MQKYTYTHIYTHVYLNTHTRISTTVTIKKLYERATVTRKHTVIKDADETTKIRQKLYKFISSYQLTLFMQRIRN